MDGRLLILCDELPKDYERYSVKDVYYLRSEIIDPDDNPDQLFVCWDAIIPQDRSFIEGCMHYATTYEQMPVDFRLRETGKIDGKHGNIKGSIQEDSYIHALDRNIALIRSAVQKGEDASGEAMDLAVQYPMQATQQFLEDFSSMLNRNGIVRVLATHKHDVDSKTIRYRNALLEAWQNQNRFMRENASYAKLLNPMVYEDFGQVYVRALDEIMKIYSLPIFGEEQSEERRYV